MFSVSIYLFFTGVSLWASGHFRRAFKEHPYANYREFFFFFLFLGIGMFLYPLALLLNQSARGIVIEVGNFLILLSFAFVFRAFLRFQRISFIAPATILIIFAVSAVIKFSIGIIIPAVPVMQDHLIYWHYPLFHAIFFGAFVAVFTISMAYTLLANMGNVMQNKKTLLLLGLGFIAGGVGGVFVHSFNVFLPLMVGYLILLACAVFWLIFILISANKKQV